MQRASPPSAAPTARCTWATPSSTRRGASSRRSRRLAAAMCAPCWTSSKAANGRCCGKARIVIRDPVPVGAHGDDLAGTGDGAAGRHPAPTPHGHKLRIGLVAGEASGDLLGAGLVEELRLRFPGAEFAGIGGAAMRAAGVDTWHDASELAVMGLSEVLRHLPRLLRLRGGLRRRLLEWRADVCIGIDAPDFNLGLERALKRRRMPTVHYVSPSVWAWRQGRAAKIG